MWRSNEQITAIYERHADTVYRVCALFFGGCAADAEDALQTTFLKLMTDDTRFRDEEHEKAWLIVTASNVCKDALSSGWRRRVRTDESGLAAAAAPQKTADETLACIMALPKKYMTAVYLYYYEGYSCREIAGYMGKEEASVWGYLHVGRRLLKQALQQEDG